MSKVQSTSIEELRKQSVQNLVSNLEASAPKQTGTKQSINPQDFTFNKNAKFNTSNIDSKLGEDNKYVSLNDKGLQQQMDDGQSNWSSGFNAVVGGVGSGLATMVEDLSYIPQLIKQQQGSEGWEKNALAEAMQGIKSDIGNTMPLYTADENGMSFWEGIKGITDSAIGFGIPGGLIGKGIGAIGKGAKATRIAAKLYKINKGLGHLASNVLKTASYLEGTAGAISSGLIMNDLEGSMMGSELYESLIQQGHSKDDAAFAATKFKNANRFFAVSDMLQVSGLFGKGLGYTRNKGVKKGFGEMAKSFTKVSTKNPIAQGLGEAYEEIGQGVLSNEFEYQADSGMSILECYPGNS